MRSQKWLFDVNCNKTDLTTTPITFLRPTDEFRCGKWWTVSLYVNSIVVTFVVQVTNGHCIEDIVVTHNPFFCLKLYWMIQLRDSIYKL